MELYKNYHDKPYKIVVAILAAMAALSSIILLIGYLSSDLSDMFIGTGGSMLVLLLVSTWIGVCVFSILYPFHLLNTDYKNKVMSLIFASGVSREHFYLVKVGATILSTLIALAAIFLIPFILLVVANPEFVVEVVQNLFEAFELSDIFAASLWSVTYVIGVLAALTGQKR